MLSLTLQHLSTNVDHSLAEYKKGVDQPHFSDGGCQIFERQFLIYVRQ